MLIPYINQYKKVAMGLLSYIDDYKDLDSLNAEMEQIESGKRKLLLWKDEETDNVVGLIGFDQADPQSNLLVRYLSISPSFRNEGLSYTIMNALANEYPKNAITGTLDMADFMSKWALHEQRTAPSIVSLPDDESESSDAQADMEISDHDG